MALASKSSSIAALGQYFLATSPTPGTGIAYSSSILGNNVPVAAGMAMRRTLAGLPGVIFVVTGDGAMEEGTFWETSIFARSHKLPLVIVVENNDFSMSSTIEQRRSAIDLSQVCAGLGIEYFRSSGAAVDEATASLGAARASAANGSPACVELDISTFCQHAGPTPGWPDDPLRLSLEDGLAVEDSSDDPLFHIRKALGADEFQRLSDQVLKAGNRE